MFVMRFAFSIVLSLMGSLPLALFATDYIFPFSDGVDIPLGNPDRLEFSTGFRITGQPKENGWQKSWYIQRPGQQEYMVHVSNTLLARELLNQNYSSLLTDLGQPTTIGGVFQNGRLLLGAADVELALDVLIGNELTIGLFTDPDKTVATGVERSKVFFEQERSYLEAGGGFKALYSKTDLTLGLPRVDEARVYEAAARADQNFNLGAVAALNSIAPIGPTIDAINAIADSLAASWELDMHSLELTPYLFVEVGHEFECKRSEKLHSVTPYCRFDVGYSVLGIYGKPGGQPNINVPGIGTTDEFGRDDPFGLACHGWVGKAELGTRILGANERVAFSFGLIHEFERNYSCFETNEVAMGRDPNNRGFVELEIILGD